MHIVLMLLISVIGSYSFLTSLGSYEGDYLRFSLDWVRLSGFGMIAMFVLLVVYSTVIVLLNKDR